MFCRLSLTITLICFFSLANSQTYYHNTFLGSQLTINWSNHNLISTDNDWSNIPYMKGFKGENLSTIPDVDPRTITADGMNTTVTVTANQNTPAGFNGDGFAEFESMSNPTLGLRASVTASAPFLVFYVNTQDLFEGYWPTMDFTLIDIDGSANDAVSRISIQYRIGETGPFIPAQESFEVWPNGDDAFTGYHPDATQGPFLQGHKSHAQFVFPSACWNQPKVQVRLITSYAAGENEWIGIDDIRFGGVQILPVWYSSFSAMAEKNSMLVKWNASTESLYDRFEIERSADGNAFNKIGNEASKGTGEFDYSFTDISPIKGNSFYRLKMISQNNSFNYTNVVKVKWDSKDVFISALYPTIATSKINLLVASDKIYNASLQIENISGALIKKRSVDLIAGSNNIPVDINDLPAGNYFIRLYLNGESFTERFIKQ